jgi:hypothetical protein
MGWLWIAVPVVVPVPAAVLDRRARRQGHLLKGAASIDQALRDRVDHYQQDRPVALPSGIERAAGAVVALMDGLDGRLRSPAQILLSRVQGGL